MTDYALLFAVTSIYAVFIFATGHGRRLVDHEAGRWLSVAAGTMLILAFASIFGGLPFADLLMWFLVGGTPMLAGAILRSIYDLEQTLLRQHSIRHGTGDD